MNPDFTTISFMLSSNLFPLPPISFPLEHSKANPNQHMSPNKISNSLMSIMQSVAGFPLLSQQCL